MFAHGETIQIVTPATVADRYGNETSDWDNATLQDVPGSAFAPGVMEEDNQGRTAVISRPTVYLPYGTSVASTARVRVRGVDYEAVGDPADWRNPFTGWKPGVTLGLKKVDG